MPISIATGRATVCIRRAAFESTQLTRADLDHRLNLTPDEFSVEAALVVIGPLPNDEMVADVVELLEGAGLRYYDDFFDLSGSWPEWLRVYVMAAER